MSLRQLLDCYIRTIARQVVEPTQVVCNEMS
jgi:hypothetical protein